MSNPSRCASANLDALRSLAVIMVLVDHLGRHYHYHRFDNIGLFGVLLFFVHTSLVLMYSMQRSNLSGRFLVRDFYIRRFFRIYPLSVLAVLIAILLPSYVTRPQPRFLEIASNIFLIQNITYSRSLIPPLWSLPLEVQMYVVLPFIFLWQKRSLWKLLVLWMGCGLLVHFTHTLVALKWFTLLVYMPNFLPGIIAFALPEKRLLPAFAWPIFILSLSALFLWHPSYRFGALACLLLGFGVPCFKEITFHPFKLAANRVATYSYGIYLGHSFFIWYALVVHDSWILFCLMWLIIPVALYHTFERPWIEIGRKAADSFSRPRRCLISKKHPSDKELASSIRAKGDSVV